MAGLVFPGHPGNSGAATDGRVKPGHEDKELISVNQRDD
jgi:hypothetical protein